MATPFDGRLAGIVRQAMTEVLRPRGFRKRGSVYRRQVDGLMWLIDVQKSDWNSDERARFSVNFGVYVPGVMGIYGNRPESAEPQVPSSCVYGRPSDLKPGGEDQWWELRADDVLPSADERACAQIQHLLIGRVLPFLERFQTTQDVVDYLESTRGQRTVFWPPNDVIRLTYLGVLYHLAGDQARCHAVLAEAHERAAGGPAASRIRNLTATLCGP